MSEAKTGQESTAERTPTADPTEDNAFFPSPYSLSQYTAAKTDFDGLSTDATYAGGHWKVLVVATEERYMRMHNGRFFSTGNHPVETLLPIHHISRAGYDIDIATPTGAPAKFEWWAFPEDDDAVSATWNSLRDSLKSPKGLTEVVDDGLDDYAAIFIPGGHGAMNGIPGSIAVKEALDFFLDNERLIISLCHGPAAFHAAGLGRETNPFSGYSIIAFPDALDFGANIDIGYLPGEMPWRLGATLEAQGLRVINDDMSGATTRDRNVLTGDSPLAANQLGKDSVAALLDAFGD